MHVWNVDDETLLTTIPRTAGDHLALSPDDSLLLLPMGTTGSGVELWSVREGSLVASYSEGALTYVNVVSFSPDGSLFATADVEGRTHVQTLNGDLVVEVQQGGAITAAAFSSDGHLLVTASVDGTAAVSDLDTGQRLSTYTGHAGAINAAAFSTSDDLVATGGDDGKVQLWRPSSGDEVATLAGHRSSVHDVAFSAVEKEQFFGKLRLRRHGSGRPRRPAARSPRPPRSR